MKQRLISAVVALAIFVPLIITGNFLFKLGIVIIGVLGLKEVLNVKFKKNNSAVKYLMYFLLVLLILNNNINLDFSIIGSMLLIFGILFLLQKDFNILDISYLIFFVILIGYSLNLFIYYRTQLGLNYIVYLLLVTISTDTYAFIAGNLIGKHKLMEKVSPKKTIEGFVIGSIFGTLIASTFYYVIINDSINIVMLILITLLLTIVGQFGDLFFSKVKREFKVKDFSNIMPGHGGILDRIDSIIFVTLLFVIFSSYL